MDYAALRTEIQTGPLAAELAPHWTAGEDYIVANILNRVDIDVRVPITITDRGLKSKLGAVVGGTIMLKLKRASVDPGPTADPQAQLMACLIDDARTRMLADGLDFGDAQFIAQLDSLANVVFTQAEVDAMKALSMSKTSRAMQALGAAVSSMDVARARMA